MKNYKAIIGLEIHAELKTNTKMFCKCLASYFGEEPNTHTCPICLGLPGALPYPNKKAVENCIMIAQALNCNISLSSFFERKHYFYPDLPKGFQISQYINPFGENGFVEIEIGGKSKKIKIERVHMEEDTGKIIHTDVNGEKASLIDFNRSGVPLVEIVTEPDIESGIEARFFLTKLQKIIRYLGVSDADMEKGDMRLEPNISVRREDQEGLPEYKVEVKNINSFRFVEKAIDYEISRQIKILEKGEKPTQETRGWDEPHAKTVPQRIKEEAHDYRYFPEPDIPPLAFTNDEIEKIKQEIPELPDDKIRRFEKEYSLSHYDAEILTRDITLSLYFEEAIRAGKEFVLSPKQIANTIINQKIDTESVLPAQLVKNIVSNAKVDEVSEEELENAVKDVISESKNAVSDYKNGKLEVLGFLIGSVNRKIQKKVDTSRIKDIIKAKID